MDERPRSPGAPISLVSRMVARPGMTARDEIVAPVIITTSFGPLFPRSFFTPLTGATAVTNPFMNALSDSILLPRPGVSLLAMTFIAISV